MKKLLIVRLIIIVALGDVAKSGVPTFKWKSSSLFPNGTVVQANVGDNVKFPWDFDMKSPKDVVIVWTKASENKPDQEKDEVLAKYHRYTFIGLSRERDVEFLPNAGINLPNVTLAEKGVYTVEINLFGHRKSYKQVAFLQVSGMVQSKIDGISSMVQSKFDNIKAMVQSKSDNVNPTVLQPQSGPMDSERRPASCVDVQKYDKVSGVHTLFVNNNIPIKVYCDQQTDNGGWTVFQRRQDGSVDFTRDWEEYEKGFGDLNGEFWIGLANLHQLTKSKTVKLRVDLTDVGDSTAYAVYNTFSISSADDKYRLHVGGYSGTAGDSLASHNEMQFSTLDRDHDTSRYVNCAAYKGGWWYHKCSDSNLNGNSNFDSTSRSSGASWSSWKGDIPFKRVEMKFKE